MFLHEVCISVLSIIVFTITFPILVINLEVSRHFEVLFWHDIQESENTNFMLKNHLSIDSKTTDIQSLNDS